MMRRKEEIEAIGSQHTRNCKAEAQTVRVSLCSRYMCKRGASDDNVKLCIIRRDGFQTYAGLHLPLRKKTSIYAFIALNP